MRYFVVLPDMHADTGKNNIASLLLAAGHNEKKQIIKRCLPQLQRRLSVVLTGKNNTMFLTTDATYLLPATCVSIKAV